MDFQDFSTSYVQLLGEMPMNPVDPDRMAHFHQINKEAFELLSKIKNYFEEQLPDGI